MKYSIVIPTCNQSQKDLIPCIESIKKNTNLEETEIIVVVNGYNPRIHHYQIKYVLFANKIGYPKAINEGIKVAKGEFIILLNDDTIILNNNWIDLLKKPFDENCKTGITGPVKFWWNCGEIKRECIAFWCCMFKKSLIQEIGYLNEIFTPGTGEDGDFSVRANIIGYDLVQVPINKALNFGEGFSDSSFPIYHKGNGTFSSLQKDEIIERNNKILESIYSTRLEKIYNICLNHECDINKLFPILRKYASQCEHVTELGVRGVFSTYAFLASKPKIMKSYDIIYSLNIEETKDVAKENNINFQFIQEDTRNIEIEETDLLFIDTLHTYEQLSKELELHGNKAKKYILLHDTTTWGEKNEIDSENEKQGLNFAIKEFLNKNPNWKIKEIINYSNGLTILERIPAFSIVIPTCTNLIKECLKRVFDYTNLYNTEVIVVANGCNDETQKYLESIRKKIKLINLGINKIGAPAAYNTGVAVAEGNFIILLDDDTFLLEQNKGLWIELLSEAFISIDKPVGISGPIAAENYKDIQKMIIHSGCAMYSKEVWNKVGGFDESYGIGYFSDSDLSLRISEAGYEVRQVGLNKTFPIYHPEAGVLEGKKAEEENAKILKINGEKLYLRHSKNKEIKIMKPKFSIIIPTYGMHLEDCLKPCLNAIIQYTNLENVEVIVVANGCKDETAEFVNNLNNPFKLVWFDEALGYTKATNEGIKIAQGEYVVLLNNDAFLIDMKYPKNAWLDMLVKPFESDEKVGITGPLQLYDNYSARDVMIFFCVCIKKELFDKIGLLDESYSPGGGEDICFSVQAQDMGYKQVVVPDNNVKMTWTNVGGFPIYHKGEATFSEKEFPEYGKKIVKENGMKNMLRYNKHIKLNLGSGGVEVPGYLGVDKYDYRAHIIMDVCDLNLPENSVEEILASHLLEHINPYKVVDLFKRWLKILKPNGKLIMELPNIEELCKDFVTADKQTRYGILNCFFCPLNTTDSGKQSDITSPHLWGWYPEIMFDHLTWAGFKDIIFLPEQIPHPLKNFRVEAKKPL